jgi:hypothetical protein
MEKSAVAIFTLWTFANCFFGYRIFRGVTAFYSILFITLLAAFLAAPYGPLLVLLAMIAGIIAGWFLRDFLYHVIVFIMGFLIMGIVILFALEILARYAPGLSELWRMIIAVVAGLIGGMLAMHAHKPVFMTSSAVLGAAGTVCGVDFFIREGGSILVVYGQRGGLHLLRELFMSHNFLALLFIAAVSAGGILVQHYTEKGHRKH